MKGEGWGLDAKEWKIWNAVSACQVRQERHTGKEKYLPRGRYSRGLKSR